MQERKEKELRAGASYLWALYAPSSTFVGDEGRREWVPATGNVIIIGWKGICV